MYQTDETSFRSVKSSKVNSVDHRITLTVSLSTFALISLLCNKLNNWKINARLENRNLGVPTTNPKFPLTPECHHIALKVFLNFLLSIAAGKLHLLWRAGEAAVNLVNIFQTHPTKLEFLKLFLGLIKRSNYISIKMVNTYKCFFFWYFFSAINDNRFSRCFFQVFFQQEN